MPRMAPSQRRTPRRRLRRAAYWHCNCSASACYRRIRTGSGPNEWQSNPWPSLTDVGHIMKKQLAMCSAPLHAPGPEPLRNSSTLAHRALNGQSWWSLHIWEGLIAWGCKPVSRKSSHTSHESDAVSEL